MKFLSVCSGIEAASVAWRPLGWEALAYAEIEPFPCAVLAHHYPDVPNRGDMTNFQEWPDARPDVLVGGTPCQSFSVAGLRAGLDDPRGQLMLAYGAVARQYRPRWLVWENVPGVLSSHKGRDFGTFLGMLAELGYGFAYRVLDAQYFGVPQRRRRVFVVGRLGDWRRAAAVLFERHGLSGHPPPRREAGEGVAGTVAASLRSSGGPHGHSWGLRGDGSDNLIAPTLPARAGGGGGLGTDFDLDGGLVAYRTSPNCGAWDTGDRVDALTTGTDPASHVLAFQERGRKAGRCLEIMGDIHPALLAPDGGGRGGERNILAGTGVRRLTPRECERLQGFPDIKKTCIITISNSGSYQECLDHQKNFVNVETLNRKSPKPALNAGENESRLSAKYVEPNFNADQERLSEPVLAHVRIDLERQGLQIHSQGRLLLSANIAEKQEWCRLPIRIDAFAQLTAKTLIFLERETHAGKEESRRIISDFSLPWNGRVFVNLYGQEIEELASDVGSFIKTRDLSMRFITSEAGQSFQNSEKSLQISFYCVATAISSFIQERIHVTNSYSISIEIIHGYTRVPYRGKPAADGPRYKALGNSMAVPVMRWIGERIQAVEAMGRPASEPRPMAQRRAER